MKERVIGIMGAMNEEVNGVIALVENPEETVIGRRHYYRGTINGVKVVVVFSRWGKVAAATTVSTLINIFNITELIFTGVAGAISDELRIGDIVIGKRLMQHDMDSRPMMKQYEIPLDGKVFFECDPGLLSATSSTIEKLISDKTFNNEDLASFHITSPRCHTGDIASGDQFFSSSVQKDDLKSRLPSILCVEMEGAAVAQICYEYNIPCVVIRTISDTSDEKSPVDFQAFIQKVASFYSKKIIERMVISSKI